MKIVGTMDGAGKRIVVIVSRWNELVTKALTEGALDTLSQAGCTDVRVVEVPGAWEIPLTCLALIEAGNIDGIVALGCILQGQTTHAALLSKDVSGALMNIQNQTGIPIGWGILTPEDQEQALDRSGMKLGNKGREAAGSTLYMVNLLDAIVPKD
jgi:6,7-dimethyl-8-ribityllumazine synthase